MIVLGDFNQDINNLVIEKFMRENKLCETHQKANNFEGIERNKAHLKGQNQIDSVFGTEKMIYHIRGRRMIDFNEMLPADHRGFLFDIDYVQYFKLKLSNYHKTELRKLNLSNKKYCIAFKENLEEHAKKIDWLKRQQEYAITMQ